ncbi:predicted protein [Phaeodactylum tricornutum CCAP 1055/1]|jgi:hypothetical protein|uniref:Uncharacterized protein n=2 Tax=Phaeodactylum tricornutum TaxID=2850 RepID=B5Y3Z2_PHATC|nr:predicted protein [Phaeodactylum tricornutum CCAP 1055/1]ACI65217.1 predicted protein [Phaeodactylum tricornutum CCAP 1055/1]|eukprot:XP_002185747.1 predicted protein [Phaeodactylum tricornutum CCAP 1055/1]
MKLFAKRKRTVDAKAKSRCETFQSDKQVEELLIQDPSTWNAKQRRMINRYQDRKATEATETLTGATDGEALIKETIDRNEAKRQSKVSSDDGIRLPDEGNDEAVSESKELGDLDIESTGDDNTGATNIKDENNGVDDELQLLLDKINSKQRRKISRSVERGELSPADAKKEAQTVLAESIPKEASRPSQDIDLDKPEPHADGSPKKKRRRKGGEIDLSKLSPEERLRREDQRRRQQEAADRAARAPSGHSHPLNSERRRANRRKPKWSRKQAVAVGNEHDSSGYHMRRNQDVVVK